MAQMLCIGREGCIFNKDMYLYVRVAVSLGSGVGGSWRKSTILKDLLWVLETKSPSLKAEAISSNVYLLCHSDMQHKQNTTNSVLIAVTLGWLS